jgi:hypothetical protein
MWDLGILAENGPRMTGNAWLLETKPDGTAVLLVNQLRVVELLPPEVMEQRMKARMAAMEKKMKAGQTPDAENPGELEPDEDDLETTAETRPGSWKEADLKADTASLIEFLNKSGKDNEYELKQSAAGFFLFAAHLNSRGQVAEANQIISLLFQKVGESRKVVASVMNQIAEVEYNKVCREFETTGDWPRYLSAMEGLLRLSSSWRNAPLVEKVAGMVRKQLEQKSAPALTGEGLTEDDTRIATLLGRPDAVVSLHNSVFSGMSWLTADPVPAGGQKQGEKTSGPLDLIQQRGARAVPLLVAMLNDGYLVRTKGGEREDFSAFEADDDLMSAEEQEQRMEQFPRPLSRGEIARRILEPLVSDRAQAGNPDNKLTVEELAQKSRAWYEKHKTPDRSGLRRQLLAEGSEEMLGYLMASQDPADRAAAESHLMNPDRLLENLSNVFRYAQQQGPTVKLFVRGYLAELNKLPSLVPKRNASQMSPESLKAQEEQIRSAIKVLGDLVSDKTTEQVLQELTSPEKKWNAQERRKTAAVLLTKLAQEEPDKALTLLLQACLKAKDGQLAGLLVQCAGSLRWVRANQRGASGAPRLPPPELKIGTHADLWKQVFALEPGASSDSDWGGTPLSFKDQVAAVIEGCYGDEDDGTEAEAARLLGVRIFEVIVQRAQSRLEGKTGADLPAYPNKMKVSKERAAQIGELLRSSAKEKQHEIAGNLSLDEIMALPDLIAGDPKLNEKLVPGSHLVEDVRVTAANEDLSRLCLSLKGKPLDRAALESLIAGCKKQAEQGSVVQVLIERRLPLAGLSLSLSSPQGQGGATGSRPAAGREAVLTATLQSEGPAGVSAYMQWPIKRAAPPQPGAAQAGPARSADDDLLTENKANSGEYFERQEQAFWKGLETLHEPARDVCQPYTLTLSVQGSGTTEVE